MTAAFLYLWLFIGGLTAWAVWPRRPEGVPSAILYSLLCFALAPIFLVFMAIEIREGVENLTHDLDRR